jgi:hypothetical protein
VREWSVDRNEASAAFVRDDEPLGYFTGAFFGGFRAQFEEIARGMQRGMATDDRNNIVALWVRATDTCVVRWLIGYDVRSTTRAT